MRVCESGGKKTSRAPPQVPFWKPATVITATATQARQTIRSEREWKEEHKTAEKKQTKNILMSEREKHRKLCSSSPLQKRRKKKNHASNIAFPMPSHSIFQKRCTRQRRGAVKAATPSVGAHFRPTTIKRNPKAGDITRVQTKAAGLGMPRPNLRRKRSNKGSPTLRLSGCT